MTITGGRVRGPAVKMIIGYCNATPEMKFSFVPIDLSSVSTPSRKASEGMNIRRLGSCNNHLSPNILECAVVNPDFILKVVVSIFSNSRANLSKTLAKQALRSDQTGRRRVRTVPASSIASPPQIYCGFSSIILMFLSWVNSVLGEMRDSLLDNDVLCTRDAQTFALYDTRTANTYKGFI